MKHYTAASEVKKINKVLKEWGLYVKEVKPEKGCLKILLSDNVTEITFNPWEIEFGVDHVVYCSICYMYNTVYEQVDRLTERALRMILEDSNPLKDLYLDDFESRIMNKILSEEVEKKLQGC